ncbi:MAG: ABC transporter permease [Gemmatimonadota bacterium]|nr:ABC transporter permease [Gemmatimonadota bacterium]
MRIWSLAWRTAFARKRLFAWNVAIPALLLTPVAVSAAAAPHRTAVFGVFIVFFATFGASIPTVRDARGGWLDTVFLTGYGRSRWFAETVCAGAILDLIQLLPVVAVLVWSAGGTSAADLAYLAGALLLALVSANAIGPFIAAVVRSLAEAALASAAVSLLLLHFSGFFRAPVDGWTRSVASAMPYRPLREGLAAVQTSGTIDGDPWVTALVVAMIAVLVLLVTSRFWTRRFEWPYAG